MDVIQRCYTHKHMGIKIRKTKIKRTDLKSINISGIMSTDYNVVVFGHVSYTYWKRKLLKVGVHKKMGII